MRRIIDFAFVAIFIVVIMIIIVPKDKLIMLSGGSEPKAGHSETSKREISVDTICDLHINDVLIVKYLSTPIESDNIFCFSEYLTMKCSIRYNIYVDNLCDGRLRYDPIKDHLSFVTSPEIKQSALDCQCDLKQYNTNCFPMPFLLDVVENMRFNAGIAEKEDISYLRNVARERIIEVKGLRDSTASIQITPYE